MKPSKQAAAAATSPDDGATVWLYEAQKKVYPRSISGLFTRWRWFFVFATQLFFYGMPWVQWGGRQAMLFDLEARRFYIFGLVLYPQDVIYLTGILIISALLLFLFTAVAGRQWCGYACPQTVYTEIYLWVEKQFEGDRQARLRLDAGPMSPNKLWRKAGKHAVWIAIGLWTGLSFVGYFTPIRELVGHIATWSLGPWETFWVFFYGFATWGNAGFMREQVCKYMCPYARFQSAMFDKDTLIVTYDAARGEPRGGRSKKADPKALGLGDCIDCTLCVQVCPTGIDIRDGLQLECIGCAACIDACDQVMDKISQPRGLIRYSTENALKQQFSRATILRRAIRPRVLIYSAIFLSALGATAWSLATRVPLKLDIQRDRAALSTEAADGATENTFRLQLINASEQPRIYRVAIDGLDGIHLAQPLEVEVAAAATASATARVQVDPGAAASGSHPVRFTATDTTDPAVSVSEKAKFWIP